MWLRVFLIAILVVAGATSGAPAADSSYMGYSAYGYSGYSLGGAIYVNAVPYFADVSLDGKPIGVANDLQASLVDARAGVHALTVTAPGYEPATVLVRVLRDWTTRVRLTLVPAR
jgi:expansin (peptidoglycan-binding protein)